MSLWITTLPCLVDSDGYSIELTFGWAGMHHGKRVISCSHLTPGRIRPNLRFAKLWVEATEREHLGNEAYFTAQRERPGKHHGRDGMWEMKGYEALRHDLGVALHRYGGFDKAWKAAHRKDNRYGGSEAALAAAVETQALTDYWTRVAEVRRMIEDTPEDDLQLVHDPLPLGQHPRTHLTPAYRSTGGHWLHIPTKVLVGGEHVGWLGTDGYVYPLEDLAHFERRAKNP